MLGEIGIRVVADISYAQKVDHRIFNQSLPSWAIDGKLIKVMIKTYANISTYDYRTLAETAGILGTNGEYQYPYIFAHIELERIQRVSQLPFVQFIEIGPAPDIAEDIQGTSLQRGNVLKNRFQGGLALNGSGVNVMVRDQGIVGPHIDFAGRIVNMIRSDAPAQHSDGVAGVFAGAGNIDPRAAASASSSTIYAVEYISTFLDSTEALHQSDNVVITNSSFSNGCNLGYTSTTQRVDQQMIDNPKFSSRIFCRQL